MIMNVAGIFAMIRVWNDFKYVDGRASALGKEFR